jgi:hypothetical protein
MAEKLKAENYTVIQEQGISYMGWLSRPKEGKLVNALVVEFTAKPGANACMLLRRSHGMGYQRVYSSIVGYAKLFNALSAISIAIQHAHVQQ